MTLQIITPPAEEPVDLAYAKTFLRIDHDHEDQLISDMLTSARLRVEDMIGRALVTQRVVKSYPPNSGSVLRITPVPVKTVHEVRVRSTTNDVEVLPQWAYTINKRREPATVTLKIQTAWHEFIKDIDAIEIEFTCGYGDATSVPHPLKQAILLLLAQSYELRGHAGDAPVPMMVDAVLMPYRWIQI